MVTDWMVIGPFPNPDREGYDTAYPPENAIDLSASCPGRDGKQVAWQRLTKADGIMLLNDLANPKEHSVFYGACVVTAPKAGRQTMLVGSDDGVKIWINGKLVHANKDERPLMPDQDRLAVKLEKGDNVLLLKVEQRLGDVGFVVRFQDPKDELSYALPK